MTHTHYLIIDQSLESTVLSLLPDCPVKDGRASNLRHVYGQYRELHAAQWLLRDELQERRTYLIRLPPPPAEKPAN